jgi:hypothetical protein
MKSSLFLDMELCSPVKVNRLHGIISLKVELSVLKCLAKLGNVLCCMLERIALLVNYMNVTSATSDIEF